MPAITVTDSAYFTFDGVSVNNCGSALLGAVAVSNSATLLPGGGNNTMFHDVNIVGSLGSGFSVTNGFKVIISQSTVSGSAGSGVLITNSVGSLITDSIISSSSVDGVTVLGPSSETLVVGNNIVKNTGVGVNFNNPSTTSKNQDSIVMRNSITGNGGGSVLFSAATFTQGNYMNIVSGNTFSGNGKGVEIGGCTGCVQRLVVANNKDSDGVGPTYAKSVTYKNFLFDPYNRFSMTPTVASSTSGASNTPIILGGAGGGVGCAMFLAGLGFHARRKMRAAKKAEVGGKNKSGIEIGGSSIVAYDKETSAVV